MLYCLYGLPFVLLTNRSEYCRFKCYDCCHQLEWKLLLLSRRLQVPKLRLNLLVGLPFCEPYCCRSRVWVEGKLWCYSRFHSNFAFHWSPKCWFCRRSHHRPRTQPRSKGCLWCKRLCSCAVSTLSIEEVLSCLSPCSTAWWLHPRDHLQLSSICKGMWCKIILSFWVHPFYW